MDTLEVACLRASVDCKTRKDVVKATLIATAVWMGDVAAGRDGAERTVAAREGAAWAARTTNEASRRVKG